jgi:Tfp pilus assembly protein PilF
MDAAIQFQKSGKHQESERIYRQILTAKPDWTPALNNLGNALAATDRTREAVEYYQRALVVQPDFVDAAHNLARVCHQSGQLDAAIDAYVRVLRMRPEMVDAHNNMGIALCTLNRFSEGCAAFQRALKLRPKQPHTYNNLGNGLCAQGLFDEAIGSYHRALALRPNYPAAHLNLGLVLLSKGNFVRGWPEYEWRWRIDDPRSRLNLNTPWWDGNMLAGRTLLLHNEQGFGDTIHFVRYIPEILERGAKIILMCQPALLRLMKQIKGLHRLLPSDQSAPKHDYHCPMLTLPGVMGTTLESIPAPVPYLRAEEIYRNNGKRGYRPMDD